MERDVELFLTRHLDTAELTDDGRREVARLDRTAARFVSGEQSNSSVIVPGRGGAAGVIVKAIREPAPGPHPDVELPRALWRVGWRQTPELLGVGHGPDGAVTAIVSAFVPGAADGFELACRLARQGVEFAAATDLGRTVAELHASLRRAFASAGGPAPADGADNADGTDRTDSTGRADENAETPWQLADRLRRRAAWAIEQVPALAAHRPAIGRVLDGVAALPGPLALQRIHGDLHLGQTLHAGGTWFVLDFEGEPLVPLAERSAPDAVERDLAGIVRSIDYAAAVGGAPSGWRERATADFLTGVGDGANPVLLRAFTLDKALYECVYEQRNRPDWLAIPLAAVAAVAQGS